MKKQISESSFLYEEGRQFFDNKNFELASEKFKESCNLFPHFKTLELLGECFLKQEKYNQAIIYLAAAVGLGNKSYRSYYLLAKALLEVGEVNKAIEKLKEALILNPNYKEAEKLLLAIS